MKTMLMPKLFNHVNCPANVISAFDKPCIPLKTSMKSLFMSRNGHDMSMTKMYGNGSRTFYTSERKYAYSMSEKRVVCRHIDKPIEIHNSECSKTRKLGMVLFV
jgi:hypothetical protein